MASRYGCGQSIWDTQENGPQVGAFLSISALLIRFLDSSNTHLRMQQDVSTARSNVRYNRCSHSPHCRHHMGETQWMKAVSPCISSLHCISHYPLSAYSLTTVPTTPIFWDT